MTTAPGPRGIVASLHDFKNAKEGVSAVEFALVVPFMLTLFLGGVQLSDAASASRKVTIATRAVADLATQYISISNAQMNDILNASSAVMAPYSIGNLVITLSSVSVDNSSRASVAWSRSLNGTPLSTGQSITLPSDLNDRNMTLIWARTSYTYTPWLSFGLTGPVTITNEIYMRPRLSTSVSLSGS